tara:strand:+ start:730 stop:894 length:165 start_codon:yes stop_codon:yes gene_type:complete
VNYGEEDNIYVSADLLNLFNDISEVFMDHGNQMVESVAIHRVAAVMAEMFFFGL